MSKKISQLESAFCWGEWQRQIKETFDKARPILDELPSKTDKRYVFYLLREQTHIASKWRNPHQRRIEKAWREVCRATDTFLRELGMEQPSPALTDALREYSENLSLPSYKEALEEKDVNKGDAFWSDAVSLALEKHFIEKTGTPRRTLVAQLMSCSPAMTYKQKKGTGENPVSMRSEDIRLRLASSH